MGFVSSNMKLNDIQVYLEEAIQHVNAIGEIPLTEEDYRYLEGKIKLLFQFSANSSMMIDYKLCVVVYWVFAMVYGEKEDNFEHFTKIFDKLPQYLYKNYLNLCLDVFREYGFYTKNEKLVNPIEKVKHLILMQAGLEKLEINYVGIA